MGSAPLAIVQAQGAHVFDQSGRRFIDWIGAWGPALLGHAHPAIEKALADALPHGVLFGLASPREIELAERVTARVPG
jgi:glutamate-1-semialdehyde 2,1-aminomutase